jgi:hypothetical protein
MSQATTKDSDDAPPFNVNKAVIRRMAQSDRESAWIYKRFLEFFYDDNS